MAVKPFCQKAYEVGENPLLIFHVVNIDQVEFKYFFTEESMLGTLED